MGHSSQTDSVIQLINQGDLEKAEQICLNGQKETGDHEYLYLLGIIRAQQKRFDDAINHLKQAVKQLPDRADIAYNLGTIYQANGDLHHAVEQWERAVDIDPQQSNALYNLALGLDQLGRTQESEKTYETLISVSPDHVEAHYNLANLKVRLENFQDSLPHYQRVIEIKPDFEAGWINCAIASQRIGNLDEAETQFNQALALNPDSVEAHWNLAHLFLIQGRWKEGFVEYEWRLKRPEAPQADWPQPVWDGRPAPNQCLMLWVDQGIGDAIQFLRYTRIAAERVGKVILRCQANLTRLSETAPGIDQAVAIDQPLPDFDCHAPLMSLPLLTESPGPTGTWNGPYLSASAPISLEAPKSHKRVGLVWAGNPAHRNDANRSCPLAELRPLFNVPKTSFYSLQVGAGQDALDDFEAANSIIDLAPRLHDFADTANAIAALDAVISVDTAVAHLAGALGKPTWLLLPAIDPDWRWLLDRVDTDWYPSVRLFRQKTPGDWRDPIDEISKALQNIMN